jgi:hypothetical protein
MTGTTLRWRMTVSVRASAANNVSVAGSSPSARRNTEIVTSRFSLR